MSALYQKHDNQVTAAANYASSSYETIKKFSIYDETDPNWADLPCLAVEMMYGVY